MALTPSAPPTIFAAVMSNSPVSVSAGEPRSATVLLAVTANVVLPPTAPNGASAAMACPETIIITTDNAARLKPLKLYFNVCLTNIDSLLLGDMPYINMIFKIFMFKLNEGPDTYLIHIVYLINTKRFSIETKPWRSILIKSKGCKLFFRFFGPFLGLFWFF